MNHFTTLNDFLVSRQGSLNGYNKELSKVLHDIANASKIVNRDVCRAGLVDGFIGAQGGQNVQGEEQQKLDVIADNAFINVLEKGGEVCGIASEENEDFVAFDNSKSKQGSYVVLFDPLDGSSNIDVNVSIGTIFSIYERVSQKGDFSTLDDMLQTGTHQVAAGYVLYGSSTMMVYTAGHSVHGFHPRPEYRRILSIP